MKSLNKIDWFIPAMLITLCLFTLVNGVFRLFGLASGIEVTPDNIRFIETPMPVVLHIFGSTTFIVLGAFQFTRSIRLRWPKFHRKASVVLVPNGCIAALTGLWMSHFYALPEIDGELLYVFRMFFGSLMFLSIIIGVIAIQKRNIVQHQAWMMRGYALGAAAGTQLFTHIPWILVVGMPDELPRALLMGAGWVINLVVVELLLLKKRKHLADHQVYVG